MSEETRLKAIIEAKERELKREAEVAEQYQQAAAGAMACLRSVLLLIQQRPLSFGRVDNPTLRRAFVAAGMEVPLWLSKIG